MKIKYTSVFVEDQSKALKFYTEILGFVKKTDLPVGDYRWLTVASPNDTDGIELLLEPNANPVAKTYQKALYDQGIPLTTFVVKDVDKEYEKLKKLRVKFSTKPTNIETAIIAIFDDSCGNLIQIVSE